MSLQIDHRLVSDVTTGNAVAITLPSGQQGASYTVAGAYLRYDSGSQFASTLFNVALSDTTVTVTNLTGSTWRSGLWLRVVLNDATGEEPIAPDVTTQIVVKSAGDSRHAGGQVESIGTTVATIEVLIGDTATVNNAPQYWLEYFGCGLIDVVEYALDGSRLAPGAGRTDSFLGYQLPLVLGSGTPANEIVIPMTSVNDRIGSPVIPVASTVASMHTAIDSIVASGRRVILPLEPVQKGVAWSDNEPADHDTYVNAQYAIASKHASSDRVRLADCLTGTISATGDAYADGSALNPYYDTVHPKYNGGYKWGVAYRDAMADWIPRGALQTGMKIDAALGALNLITNPSFTAGAGTGINSGTAPTSWTAARTAADSWDKSYNWGATHTMRAHSTAYALGDRVSVAAYPTYDYLCIARTGTFLSDSSTPTMDTTLFGSTTDAEITWLTVPKFSDFDGRACILIYGAGTVDNTRCSLQQSTDISMVTAGLVVGDKVRASIFHAALLPSYGAQLEIRAMTSTTKINSSIGMLQSYGNSSMIGTAPMAGRLVTAKKLGTNGWAIPAAADTLRFRFMALAKAGVTQAHLLTLPVLKKVT